jgi:ABC-type spermidine/putrescine transport system permease subunit II
MSYDPHVWGPHYWFIMQTMAQTYPLNPTQSTKRKYYDFFMNLPLFIPDVSMGNEFNELLNEYSISPYLTSRDSLVRWVHFIHNKINVRLGKPEMSFFESLDVYKQNYASLPTQIFMSTKNRQRWILFIFIFIMLIFIIYKQIGQTK